MKHPSIQVHDSKGDKFRVKSVAKNGEILQVSEPLDTKAAVKKHVKAMSVVYSSGFVRTPTDCTKKQVFQNMGYMPKSVLNPAKK